MRRTRSFVTPRTVGAVALTAALALGCITTPPDVYDLMDAPDEPSRLDASAEAAQLLTRRGPIAIRLAAARTLGRLRVVDATVIGALRSTLLARDVPELRAYAAWALGELRSDASLAALQDGLRVQLEPIVAEHVMEALAKHYAVMTKDRETLVEVVEALVYFAGNHGQALPSSYDLLSANTRTVTVNVEVLRRTVDRAVDQEKQGKKLSAEERAATYSAAYELLTRLSDNRPEIVAGPAEWATRVDASVDVSVDAIATGDPQTALVILYYLGRLAEVPEIARPSAKRLPMPLLGAGREMRRATPRGPADPVALSHRIVTTWAVARMQVHALGPRRALLLDVLSKEIEPQVLRLLADMSRRNGDFDQLQKILGVTGADG